MPDGAKIVARAKLGTSNAVDLTVCFLREYGDAGHQAFLGIFETQVGYQARAGGRIHWKGPTARLCKCLLLRGIIRRCQDESRTTVEVRQQPGKTVGPHGAVRAIASHVVNKNQPVLITKET